MATNERLELTPTIRGLQSFFLHIFVLIFVVVFIGGCSGDETIVEPENGDEKSQDSVAVRLVSWNALTGEGAVRNAPVEVAEVRFTISSPDIQTIEKTIQVAQQIVEEKFVVPEAPVVRFEVQALDGSAQLVYRGVCYAEVNPGSELIPIAMISASDTNPPSFAGLATAEAYSDTDAELSWDAATDAGSSPTDMIYLIYMATASGEQDYAFPYCATKRGKTLATLSDLDPGTTYYFVVRAMDPAGNADGNTAQQSLTTYSTNDVIYVNVDSGTDAPSCGSQGNPCKTITYAIDKSSADQTIRVAKGTYSRTTGEDFPIHLKPGMTLIGEGEWLWGRLAPFTFLPRTIVDADTIPVFESADNTSLIAFYFDANGSGNPLAVLYDNELRLTVFRCVIDGRDSEQATGIMLGGRYSRIEQTKIFGFSGGLGRAIWAWGDDIVITRNTVEDNFAGVGFRGDNYWVAHNHITNNVAGALSCASSVDPVILSNYIADNGGDGIMLSEVTRPQIIANVIHNCQRGIWLGGNETPDSGRIILNVIVNNSSFGLTIKTNDADIHNNHFACNNPYGLYIASAVEIDARWNSWENDPPTIGRNTDPHSSECPGTWDICYDDKHGGVPEPLYLPSSGKGGCAIYHVPPLSPPAER